MMTEKERLRLKKLVLERCSECGYRTHGDAELAQEFGVTRQRVTQLRTALLPKEKRRARL